jgi:hypothetical protein
VQVAKFGPSGNYLREGPKLRDLRLLLISAGVLDLCAVGQRLYLIDFSTCFFKDPMEAATQLLLDSGVGGLSSACFMQAANISVNTLTSRARLNLA